jgi:hypothetical protein
MSGSKTGGVRGPPTELDEKNRKEKVAGRADTSWTAASVIAWSIVSVLFFAIIIFVGSMCTNGIDWKPVLKANAPAIIGLQVAGAVAFGLVVFLRQTDGPIEFEGLGFKIKGAAGQVVMWVVCFLSIAGAIRWLWAW